MKNSIGLLLTEVQEFLCSEVNRVFAAIVILCILVCYGQVRTKKRLKRFTTIMSEQTKNC